MWFYLCFIAISTNGYGAHILPSQNLLSVHPIILVPGVAGSQIEARSSKSSFRNGQCTLLHKGWFPIWLDWMALSWLHNDCWVEYIRLYYDRMTHTTKNTEGIETRIRGFGTTNSIEFLSPDHIFFTAYFHEIVESLVSIGYLRGVNLRGAPYDFRKAANEHDEYFDRVTRLIEDTYEINNEKKVVIMAHSMGGLMMLHLLQSKSQEWKDKYIRSFVTLAGVWGGTLRALKVYLVGDNLGNHLVNGIAIRNEERTNPSLYWLMPKSLLWGDDEVILQSENLNITANNISKIFEYQNNTDGKMMWQDTLDLVQNLSPPNVETYCIHGDGVPSVKKIVFQREFPNSGMTLETGDGDGTVNIRSLQGCLKWRDEQKQNVYHHVLKTVNHGDILKKKYSADYVKNIVLQINSGESPDSLDEEVRLTPLFSKEHQSEDQDYDDYTNLDVNPLIELID